MELGNGVEHMIVLVGNGLETRTVFKFSHENYNNLSTVNDNASTV